MSKARIEISKGQFVTHRLSRRAHRLLSDYDLNVNASLIGLREELKKTISENAITQGGDILAMEKRVTAAREAADYLNAQKIEGVRAELKKDIEGLMPSARALAALVDLAHQRITALCDHLKVETGIVPEVKAHYEVFPKKDEEKKSDDKTDGGKDGTA